MAHVPTAEWGFHCQACFWPDTTDMMNCAHCLTWWHTCCAGVDETVPVEERSFTCPRCQNPSFTVPKGKKPSSKASSGTSSTSDARARRARLRLEKLEAQKLLMEKHLDGHVESSRFGMSRRSCSRRRKSNAPSWRSNKPS